VVKPEGKRPLGNLGIDRNDIRMDIQKEDGGVVWIDLRIDKLLVFVDVVLYVQFS
jgi:hypothetical protein